MSSGASARHRSDPERIGRFRIDGRLGSGAMGVVYTAYDELMGRQVALKVLIDDLESDPETRLRFYREALAAARVIHRNVITIFDAGEDRGRSFIAMQLLQGAPLAEYLSLAEAGALERKVDLMIQVCEGLSAAHAQQVVHRDLKPSNLFVQTDGLLKILDFGVARLADSSMTAAGTMLGTPDYMSPEQAQGTPVSARSDIFSAGAVFYFMLAGSKPFKGPNLRAVMRQLMSEDPEPLPPSVPPELAAIVLGAMVKDPASRPARIEDVGAALARFRRQYAAVTRRLVIDARALRTTVLALVNELVQASTPLGPVPLPAAAQALHALQVLESRFPPLMAADGAVDIQSVERRVVNEILADLAAQRDALVAARDELTPPAPVDSPRPTPSVDQESRDRKITSRVEAARRAIEAKHWALAVRECQQVLSLMPAHQDAAALLAEARTGLVTEQRRVALLMGEHLDRASAAIERGALDAAAAALEEADALQAGWPETGSLRRRLIEARAAADADAEIQSLMAEEIRHARAAFRRGRTDEAVQQLRTFMEMEPRAEALGAELARLEQLRQTLAAGAAAARKTATDHRRRAVQLSEIGALDDAVAAARQALAADPTDEAAASLLDTLLVRCFEARVKREEERLAQERVESAWPVLDAARRALDRGYVEFAARAAAAAGCVAPSSDEVRALADQAAAQMREEDQEIVDLGPTPYAGGLPDAPGARVPPPAAGAAVEPLRFDRAIGMLKNVFSKSAPVSPRPQGR